MDIVGYVDDIAKKAKKASFELGFASTEIKNEALMMMADAIQEKAELIKEENRRDLEAGREKGLSKAMIDRLELTDKRIKE